MPSLSPAAGTVACRTEDPPLHQYSSPNLLIASHVRHSLAMLAAIIYLATHGRRIPAPLSPRPLPRTSRRSLRFSRRLHVCGGLRGCDAWWHRIREEGEAVCVLHHRRHGVV